MLCESRSGCPEPLIVSSNPYGLCGRKATVKKKKKRIFSEPRNCVKFDVDVLGLTSLTVHTVSVARKATVKKEEEAHLFRAQELCERRGGCPRLQVRSVSVDVKQH